MTNDFGSANQVGRLRPLADPAGNAGISFHDYCLLGLAGAAAAPAGGAACPALEELTFQQQREAALRNGAALLLTEFGASDDLEAIARVADLADRYMVGWHYWHYGAWFDPTGNPAEQGLFADDLDRPGSLKQAKADILIRPHPRAVAGTPVAFRFERQRRVLRLAYDADPASGRRRRCLSRPATTRRATPCG